jgi:hypothetical protein
MQNSSAPKLKDSLWVENPLARMSKLAIFSQLCVFISCDSCDEHLSRFVSCLAQSGIEYFRYQFDCKSL